MASFGDRLAAAMARRGPLCVGIDPHPALLESWGLADTAAGARDFARTTLEAVGGHVAAVKPQSAFFERHGSAGMAALEEVVHTCRERGVLCIVDAKRGDIGSTMAGYADAFLREGGPFAGDALTLSPYLGVGSLAAAVATARENSRGVFLLALTSNPEGAQVQHARTGAGRSVAAEVAAAAAEWNADAAGTLGDVGLVVGATVAGPVTRPRDRRPRGEGRRPGGHVRRGPRAGAREHLPGDPRPRARSASNGYGRGGTFHYIGSTTATTGITCPGQLPRW